MIPRSDSRFDAHLFASRNGRNVSDFVPHQHPTPGNVGVCLSGGGSRALSCGMGQLRALKQLQVNGRSLLSQVKAVSTVSGGSWVGVPFMYLDDPVSDDEYLNGYVADPARLVPSRRNGHTLAEILDEMPEHNIGQGPSDLVFSPPGLAFCALLLHKWLKVPVDMLWQTLVGTHILSDFGLYEPTFLKKQPTTLFSYDEATLKRDILDLNPDLEDTAVHLFAEAGAARISRPFLICNSSMFVSVVGEDEPMLAPLQVTPFYTGIRGRPVAVDADHRPVGGGGVTSFGFDSRLARVDGESVTVEQQRPWALVDAVGTSSAFFAEAINRVFDEMRGDAATVKKYRAQCLQSVNDWVSRLFSRGFADEIPGLGSLVDRGLDRLVGELLEDRAVLELLDEIDTLVPQYSYWPVREASAEDSPVTDSFADGGNLENTGVASLLSFDDIDRVIAFVNTSSALAEAKLGVFDSNGNEIPGTRIFVDSQMPPLFGYQPYDSERGYRLYSAEAAPDSPVFKNNQVFESSDFAGFLTALWEASGNASEPGSNRHPAICQQELRVLRNDWFGVEGRGGPGDSRDKISIVWYYNNRARDWYELLNTEVQDILGDFDDPSSYHDFPHYSTFDSYLDKTRINLLANYTAWAVAGSGFTRLFTDLFRED